MTAEQYYFPYLFNTDSFNKKLAPFGLYSYVKYEEETKMPEELILAKVDFKDSLLNIAFGRTLMVQEDKLYHWETDTDGVAIDQISLNNLTSDPWVLNTKLDLSHLHLGKNEFKTHLGCNNFITYARKSGISYGQAAYEKFAIVIVAQEQVNLVPFHWFNQTHAEDDYVWPATARLDLAAGKLYGRGMRMPDFCIELHKALL